MRRARYQTWGPELGAWREASSGAAVLPLLGRFRERARSFWPAPDTSVFLRGRLDSFSSQDGV